MSITGSQFVEQMKNVPFGQLDAIMLKYLLDTSMVPDFLQDDVRVEVTGDAVIDDKHYRIATQHKLNYLGVGSNGDYFLAPLSQISLQAWCDSKQNKWYIPPKLLVKRVWNASACKINPQNIWRQKCNDKDDQGRLLAKCNGHPREILSSGLAPAWDEQIMINDAMAHKGCPITAFCRAKKAYITAPDMGGSRLHFTGWYADGVTGYKAQDPGWPNSPHGEIGPAGSYGYGLQDLGTKPDDAAPHPPNFADYSHGCDVVWHNCAINGDVYDFADVCSHPVLNVLVSDQGPFVPRFPNKGLKGTSNIPQLPPASAPPSNFQGPVYKTDAAGKPVLVKAGNIDKGAGYSNVQEGSLMPFVIGAIVAGGITLAAKKWATP